VMRSVLEAVFMSASSAGRLRNGVTQSRSCGAYIRQPET
jgi:hypothetical protein